MLQRALRDTFSGIVQAAIMGALGFAIAFILFRSFMGAEAAMGEFKIWLISLAGSFGALILLFLWNLICAPVRIERELRSSLSVDLSAARSELAALKSRRPFFVMEFDSIFAGGIMSDRPNKRSAGVVVRLSNVGSMPSVAHGWHLSVNIDGNNADVVILVFDRPIHIGGFSDDDPYNTFDVSDFLLNKTDITIDVGSTMRGYMLGVVDSTLIKEGSSIEITLRCKDVMKNEYQHSESMICNRAESGDSYIVGAKLTRGQGE